jgi:P4 family phage/plasmid primase-like protien
MPPVAVPVRFDCAGNQPDAVLTPEKVVQQWKTKHLYEIAFTDENDLAVLFGDVDVEVKQDITEEEFARLDEEHRLALTNFIGSHQFALASASSYPARKISWRFYVPDLVGTAKAQKDYAEAVNKDKGILLPDGTPVRLDLAVYHAGRKMRMLHAWKQTKDEDGKLETDKKKWENRPLRLVVGAEQDTILHKVRDNAERMVSRRTEKVVPLHHDDFDLVRKLVLECFAEDRANEYISWAKSIWAIKSVENTARGLELAHDFSKRSYKYNWKAVEECWKQGQDKITGGSIHYWARADNPVRYAELTARLPIEFLEKNIHEGDEGLANIFVKAYEDTIVALSGARKQFYAFNSKTGLWDEVCPEHIITLFTGTMKTILTPVAVKLAGEYKDVADSEEGKVLKKKMENTLNLIKQMTMTKTATKCSPQIFTKLLKEKEWCERLNSKKDILPVANGVLDLRTGQLRPYELEDYLTYKLDVEYSPTADTSKQDKFFADVLHKDKDAMSFAQYFLGYCLTGETNRQQFLVLEGSPEGANAKSHLISCLTGVFGRMLSTASRQAFTKKEGDNNDSLYDARFSRVVVVPELNKTVSLDEGMIKHFTGDDTINVSAKYKNNITFVPQFKVLMPLNDMFPVPAEAGAMWRRILLIQFKVRFLNKENPEWDDEMAEQGWMLEKDEKFANDLKADTTGWLAWLVKGAMEYYKNPTLEAPKTLQQHIYSKQEENDPHLRFVRKTYAITGDDKDIVPVAELSSGYSRPQNEDEKTTARRISAVMKKLKVRKGVRDLYPRRTERGYNGETGQWDNKEVEDKSVKAKATKVWIGLRKKTEEEVEAEREE